MICNKGECKGASAEVIFKPIYTSLKGNEELSYPHPIRQHIFSRFVKDWKTANAVAILKRNDQMLVSWISIPDKITLWLIWLLLETLSKT